MYKDVLLNEDGRGTNKLDDHNSNVERACILVFAITTHKVILVIATYIMSLSHRVAGRECSVGA